LPGQRQNFGVEVIKTKTFLSAIKQYLLLKIKQKNIFGINFGVNFNAQICA
jgi:hypothetical protein